MKRDVKRESSKVNQCENFKDYYKNDTSGQFEMSDISCDFKNERCCIHVARSTFDEKLS